MRNVIFFFFVSISLTLFITCKKEKVINKSVEITDTVIADFVTKVALENYRTISKEADNLYANALAFSNSRSQNNLMTLQLSWRNVREQWELSESFLFGPVSTEGLDPQIDTWPVNQNDLDSLLHSQNQFSDAFMSQLQESLKGFHPIDRVFNFWC